MREKLRAYRLTPAGGALVFVLAAAVLVLLIGPKHDQAPAFVLIVLVLFMFVVQSGGLRSPRGRGLGERRAEFDPRARDQDDHAEEPDQQALWADERERYLKQQNPGS
jgi:hypothetical protein